MFVQPDSVWLIANVESYITGDPQYEHSCKTNTDGNAGQHTKILSSDLCTYRLTHTQTAKRGWWETPVAVRLHWCQHWANRGQLLTRQIYECYSSSVRVCVCVVLLGLPLAKASLLHLHFLRTPSLSLSLCGRIDEQADFSPSSLTFSRNRGRRGRMKKAEPDGHHSFLFTLGEWKKPKYWQWQTE